MDTVSEAQQSLEKLKEEISCPICLKTFNEPKVLPCQHAYCKSPCLEQLARHGNGNISCPECRKVAQVPGNDVNNFPTAFRINRLKELLTSMEALPLAIATPPKDSPLGRCCKLHPFQHVDLYCSTCRRLICRDCVAIDRSHDSHDYDLVDKVAPAHKKALLDSLNPIAEIELDVTRALTEVARLKQAVEQQGSDVSKKVIDSFDEIIAVVKKQRQSLLQTVQELTAEKVLMINNQEEVLLAAHGESHKLIASVQDSTRNLTNEEFLSNREEVLLRISNVAGKFRNVGLTPVTVPNIAVQVVSAEKVAGLCAEDSMVYKLADPAKCRAESVQHSAATNKVSDFVVHLADLGGDPCVGEQDVTAKLKSLKFGSTAEAQVAAISPSLYKVSYLPNIYTRGRCELTVKVNSVQITDSPFQVYVKCPPTQLNTPIKVIKDLPEPVGLTLSSEEELIVATKNELVVLGSNLTKTQTVKPPIPWRPFECVADRHSNIYVSDIQNRSVHLFSDGVHISSVGGAGTSLGTFAFPNGMAMSEGGLLFVCDSKNHRIQVFDKHLTPTRYFGKQGSKSGQFNWPDDIKLDSKGNLYVTEQGNSRVQVLTQDGKFIRAFGSRGKNPGELLLPNCIHIDGELVYVSDYKSNYISVFHITGKFIHRFGGAGILNTPEGIVIDQDGFLYIADKGKNRIVIF